MTLIRRHIIRPLTGGTTLRQLALLVSAIPLGTLWFAILVTGWAVGLGLAITLLGLPILLGLAYTVRVCAEGERRLLEGLTGVRLARREAVSCETTLLTRLRALAGDATIWREQAYLMLRFVAGLPLAVATLSLIGAGGNMLAAVTYFHAGDGIDIGIWRIDTFGEALLLWLPGIVLLGLAVPAIDVAARAWTALARGVLGAAPQGASPARPARPATGGRAPRPGPGAVRGFAFHATVYVVVNAVLVTIWATTTPDRYFWPYWTLIPLGTILLVHGVIVAAPYLVPGGSRRAVGLARHAGLAGAVALLMVAIWVFTTPGGVFWPIWVIIALAVQVALHAARLILGVGEREEMAERIDVLTTTRAGAVDAQAAELRRIERDLHDGAQARLVALAMDLGLARDRLARSGDESAGTLVAGAHEEAKRALVELRDLARGIHPAVLSDRGLEAAIGSLAGASRIPVSVEVDTGGRLDPALEAAAYFMVAEALANAAKHSGAGVLEVVVAREGGTLRVRVSDDGAGGADPDGEGLTGLRRRLEAHDGLLRVVSPPGGGTTLEAVVPCGS